MDNDKLRMRTPDLMEEKFKKLQELFPNAVTETLDADGNVRRAVDADVLRQEIDAAVVEMRDERYQFTWPDKAQSVLRACAPTRKTLRLDRSKSVGRDGTQGSIDTENIYIEGDNLEALKILQETYLGKVKMIYIDPPYNTGNDFIYRDNFSEDEDEYWEESGQLDEEGGRLVQNMESSGRFHTNWLNMIYPRLWLARDLLAQDGVIFISIDDNEAHNLRKCCDDVFGAGNFVGQIIIASNSSKNNSLYISTTHEYVLCYARAKAMLPTNWTVKRNNIEEYKKRANALLKRGLSQEEIHAELAELVKYPRFFDFDHYLYADNLGLFRASDLTAPSSKLFYDIIHPVTGKPCKKGTRGWAYTKSKMDELIAENKIYFGDDETKIPQLKTYFSENEGTLPKSVLFFDSQSSTKWMKMNKFGFDFPKSVDLLRYLISMYPLKEGDLILDFFSGSGTTAHAVMQLNAEDGGNRRFIMVQLAEECAAGSEAQKAGFANICEIGEERIRRAGNQIMRRELESLEKEGIIEKCAFDAETDAAAGIVPQTALNVLRRFGYKTCDDVLAGAQSEQASSKLSVLSSKLCIDTGFRVFRVDSSNMKDVWYTPEETAQEGLGELVDNIKEDRTAEDLLFQAMLELGIELSADIAEEEIAGHRVFFVRGKNKDLAACFDSYIKEETLTEIARRQPAFAVFRDSGMPSDSAYVNFEQIFKGYSPRTARRVI